MVHARGHPVRRNPTGLTFFLFFNGCHTSTLSVFGWVRALEKMQPCACRCQDDDVPTEWIALAKEILKTPLRPSDPGGDVEDDAVDGLQEVEGEGGGDVVGAGDGAADGGVISSDDDEFIVEDDGSPVEAEDVGVVRHQHARACRGAARLTLEQVLVVGAGLDPTDDPGGVNHAARVSALVDVLNQTVDAVGLAPSALRWVVAVWRRFDGTTRAMADAALRFNTLSFPFKAKDVQGSLALPGAKEWWQWLAARVQGVMPRAASTIHRALRTVAPVAVGR